MCPIRRPGDSRPSNFETANYLVVDGTHVQLTLHRAHATGATVALGGLCGYGLEQTVDTQAGIRQVFPVIGSTSTTSLFYAGGLSALVGVQGNNSGFANVNAGITSLTRAGNVVTANLASPLAFDVSGLTLTISRRDGPELQRELQRSRRRVRQTLTYTQSGANSTSTGAERRRC